METIKTLEAEIAEVSGLIDDFEPPPNLPETLGNLPLAGLRRRLSELQEHLREEKARRDKEVLDVSLSSDPTEAGSIPLGLLGSIGNHLAKALHQTSRFIERGTTGGAVPEEITQRLDLRLAGLRQGSTRLLITGNTAPDLFGRSLLEETLSNAFELLNAASTDELTDAVAAVGEPGTNAFRELMKDLAGAGCSVEFDWNAPSGKRYRWKGDPDHVQQLAGSLEGFKQEPPETLEIHGETVTLSSKGRFEIRADSGESYPGTIESEDVLKQVEALHIKQSVTAKVRAAKIRNRITGAERITYRLLSVEPLTDGS